MRYGYDSWGYASYPESTTAEVSDPGIDLETVAPELAATILPDGDYTERQRLESFLKRPFRTPLVDDGSGTHYVRTDFGALVGLAASFARDYQEIQLDVLASRYVDYAFGKSLDKIGRLVRLDRHTNESDDHYRIRLKARFRQIVGGGTIDEIREMAAILLSIPVDAVSFNEPFGTKPATVELTVSDDVLSSSPVTPDEFVDIMSGFSAAGVDLQVYTEGGFMHKDIDDTESYGRGYNEVGYAGRLDT